MEPLTDARDGMMRHTVPRVLCFLLNADMPANFPCGFQVNSGQSVVTDCYKTDLWHKRANNWTEISPTHSVSLLSAIKLECQFSETLTQSELMK